MNYIKKNYGDIIGTFNGVQAYSNTDNKIDTYNYYNNIYLKLY